MMASLFQMNIASTSGSGSLPSNTVANPKGKLKAITTRSGIVLNGPSIPNPPPFINQEEDERVEETLTDQDLSEYTSKVPPPPEEDERVEETLIDQDLSEYTSKRLSSRSYPKNLETLGNFSFHVVSMSSSESPSRFRDVFVPVGKFTFPADFVIVYYSSDPRVPLILGRPFLWTDRALIDFHGEEMNIRDGDEKLTLNMRHDTSSYSNQPQKESINLINVFNNSSEDFLEDLFSTNQPSGNPTFSSHPELTSPEVKDDIFDPEGGNVLPE
nr:reverse transcriptase domain-containing protein [Tanacetum cinerariifolium]